MNKILKFIIKYNSILLLVILQITSFVLITRYNRNNYKRTTLIATSNYFIGTIHGFFSSLTDYIVLNEVNDRLSEHNAALKTHIAELKDYISIHEINTDTLTKRSNEFIPAKVINNSLIKQYNYLTLNKGIKHGVRPDMGVITEQGIVGIVIDGSDNFCTVMSVLNRKMTIVAKLKNNNYFGTLIWDGKEQNIVRLKEIPSHISINKKDTIVTTGYSTIFPENTLIGTIDSYRLSEGKNSYDIDVKLSTNLYRLSYVNIVKIITKEEIRELQNLIPAE